MPFRDPRLASLRPTIGPAEEGEGAALPLDDEFALHPALKGLLPLWRDKTFAPIVAVGSPHPTRSHFDAQDFMEYAAPGLRNVRSGWLNRYLQARPSTANDSPLRAVAMQPSLPRAMRGEHMTLAVPQQIPRRGAVTLDAVEDLYAEPPAMDADAPRDPVIAAGRATLEALRRYEEVMTKTPNADDAAYPRGPFADRLRAAAKLIRSGESVELICADYPGWDHHAREGGADGLFARMLAQLGDSLAAFAKDLGPHFARTLVLTMTEFGRTCQENGNTGTDHGHGGLMFALGGKVKGGKVWGRWPGLAENSLYEGRDLVVTTDFRDVFAEALESQLGFEAPRDFFPQFQRGKGLGFLDP